MVSSIRKNALIALLLVRAALGLEAPRAVVLIFADDLGFGDPSFAGHPSNETPHLDALRASGKRLTSWYSGCPVCTGSRASLMTGRVYSRVGVPGVFGQSSQTGMPLSEVTLAEQFKAAGYATGMLGKWHLGQRAPYLPAARGFDSYLGVPFSDDMGQARMTECGDATPARAPAPALTAEVDAWASYVAHGYTQSKRLERGASGDAGGNFLPLVAQSHGATTVVEQPLDLTTLSGKYGDFAREFIRQHKSDKFFLYAALAHVHTTAANIPDKQFASCDLRGTSVRGGFGDALREADRVVGTVTAAIDANGLRSETLFLFSSDNGPWMVQAQSAGSVGHLYARAAGYWNVGKGSTWEGGVRVPALASWAGVIEPGSSTRAAISSTDIFPTLSKLIGAKMPTTLRHANFSQRAVYDGVDQSDALFGAAQISARDASGDCLFLFGGPLGAAAPSAARCGAYKLHWATGPGLGGCAGCQVQHYAVPLVFDLEADPSEQFPLVGPDVDRLRAHAATKLEAYMRTYETANLTNSNGGLVADLPEERVAGTAMYAICCDRQQANTCDCDGAPFAAATSAL